jgi:Na+/melibiose symporter-like transporter
MVVSFVFPVAVTAISGGPSGNQLLGVGVFFFIQAGIAFLCCALLAAFMHPYVPPPDEPTTGYDRPVKNPIAVTVTQWQGDLHPGY